MRGGAGQLQERSEDRNQGDLAAVQPNIGKVGCGLKKVQESRRPTDARRIASFEAKVPSAGARRGLAAAEPAPYHVR